MGTMGPKYKMGTKCHTGNWPISQPVDSHGKLIIIVINTFVPSVDWKRVFDILDRKGFCYILQAPASDVVFKTQVQTQAGTVRRQQMRYSSQFVLTLVSSYSFFCHFVLNSFSFSSFVLLRSNRTHFSQFDLILKFSICMHINLEFISVKRSQKKLYVKILHIFLDFFLYCCLC